MGPSLEGRVALVTGSLGKGMGRSIAWTLAREGADVVLNHGTHHRRAGDARRVARVVEGFGGRALTLAADTADATQVRRMLRRASEELGPVDILVNNAGGAWEKRPLVAIPPGAWGRVLRAEVDGVFHTTQAVLPSMKRRRWGRIVNLGMEGSEWWSGPPYDYALGKGARHLLTRNLAHELPRWNVTINTVAPGYIPPFGWREAVDALHRGPSWVRRRQPTPQDTAEVVAFLCTEEARFVNGAVINIRPNYVGKYGT